MSDGVTHLVTRMPGAPPRRAGREWPAGEPVDCTPSAADLAALESDPGYVVVRVHAPATAQPSRRREPTK